MKQDETPPATTSTLNTTTTLNGQWPSDTWFRRALARKLKAEALELESALEREVK